LLKITYFRGILSGAVKSSGPVAAVFAVDPAPQISFLVVLFLWIFSWEIGGQNIPNDWADLDEDRQIGAKTIPVHFGVRGSIIITLTFLMMALAMGLSMFWISPGRLGGGYPVGALLTGWYFLLVPGLRLYRTRTPEDAFRLFNRASYYPLAMLLVTMTSWAI
jgi:4-hydroxybenzoate polyprenyltransferase